MFARCVWLWSNYLLRQLSHIQRIYRKIETLVVFTRHCPARIVVLFIAIVSPMIGLAIPDH